MKQTAVMLLFWIVITSCDESGETSRTETPTATSGTDAPTSPASTTPEQLSTSTAKPVAVTETTATSAPKRPFTRPPDTGPTTTTTTPEPVSCFATTKEWERDLSTRIEGLKQLIRYQNLRLRSATDSLSFISSVIRSHGNRDPEKARTSSLSFAERLLLRVGSAVSGSSGEWTSNECCFRETRATCGHVPALV